MTHLTTTQAAAVVGITPVSFRSEANRARRRGVDLRAPRETWPDARTTLYDADKLTAWIAARPGRGARTDLKD